MTHSLKCAHQNTDLGYLIEDESCDIFLMMIIYQVNAQL